MNTFLPYISYNESAACLDRQRLGKQRVEVLQILRALHNQTDGWRNHPAVKMWRNNVNSLCDYGVIVCHEWVERGYKDTCKSRIAAYYKPELSYDKPMWLTMEFCLRHRSNLLRKNPDHYLQFNWRVPTDLPYIWPE